MDEAICIKCNQSKPVEQFAPRAGGKRRTECRDCQKTYFRERYLAKADQVKARVREYQKAHPEKRKQWTANTAEKNRARAKAWREKNHDRELARHRRRRLEAPELFRSYYRAWVAKDPERARLARVASSQNRRNRIVGTVTKADYVAILERHGMRCHLCGEDILTGKDLHFDHIIPLAVGGPHAPENIAPAHQWCNQRKGARG